MNTIKIAIGLGNDAKEYLHTYHNVGFLAIDYLKRHARGTFFEGIALAKTEGYMNTAGESVRALLASHHKKPAELLLVHDDSDLLLGNYKYSFNRGSAGHKGVESAIKELGTREFWRLRIGIRKPGEQRKAALLVLEPIRAEDRSVLEGVFETFLNDPMLLH